MINLFAMQVTLGWLKVEDIPDKYRGQVEDLLALSDGGVKGEQIMDILNYVVQEGLIMIPVLYIIGEIITGTEFLSNKWIPLVLLVISIGFTPLVLGFTPLVLGAYDANNIVQAVLVAGATVFGNELLKQSSKGDVK